MSAGLNISEPVERGEGFQGEEIPSLRTKLRVPRIELESLESTLPRKTCNVPKKNNLGVHAPKRTETEQKETRMFLPKGRWRGKGKGVPFWTTIGEKPYSGGCVGKRSRKGRCVFLCRPSRRANKGRLPLTEEVRKEAVSRTKLIRGGNAPNLCAKNLVMPLSEGLL